MLLNEFVDPKLPDPLQTTTKSPLNERHCDMVATKWAMSGDNLCSGMVGMSS